MSGSKSKGTREEVVLTASSLVTYKRMSKGRDHKLTYQSRRPYKRIRSFFLPFTLIFFALGSLTYLVSFSLLRPLAWSAILSFFVYPFYAYLYERVLSKRFANGAAAVTTAAIVLLIVVPSILVGTVMAREGIRIYGYLSDVFSDVNVEQGRTFVSLLFPEAIMEKIRPYLVEYPFLMTVIRQIGSWSISTLANISKSFLGDTIRIIYQLVVIVVSSFFFIRDGHVILDYIDDIVPLPPKEKKAFFDRAKQILQAVIYGITLTAGIQGVLGAFGWWYVGLPSPALFGAIMALLAMIPFIGTPLVWGPGAIYLFYVGNIKGAIILAVWGIMIVSTVDNFIRPVFISGGGKVHVLMVFIGVVGGLATWGFLGLFLGPLIISLFIFLLDSYRNIWKRYTSAYIPKTPLPSSPREGE